ncbi:VC0807 family protein [Angustibacter aerolatus]|uniref:Intracellular septation protein A n=1 Tax=Angustibacter aerolatus TaxID=1162965 RepID=A0ABQ6JE50_9ACTN|nr:VC0807 family protein [Angustibacter aerolatus]GMA85861.1 hypothetical protein GCM10025868_11110 [Angustibacter aerolatus]
MTTGSRSATAWKATRFVVGLLVSTGLYYALRAAGASVRAALITGALLSIGSALVPLVRGERLDGVSGFLLAMLALGTVVTVTPGGERLLLAKESIVTGVSGAWFLLSLRGARPLNYTFSRPIAEGRLGWPPGWEALWHDEPAWRRFWRRSSTIWGVASLLDAVGRVVMAWRLPPDDVPALGTLLLVGTAVLVNVVTTTDAARTGLLDRRLRFHRRPDGAAQAG